LVPAAVAAHRVFAAVEALRAAASGLPAKPLLSSYFARGESLAAAVEACCWLGVEACLGAGAPATLVSVPVAMKLLHACAARGSGPAAGYAPRSPGCPLRTDCVAASSGPGSGSGAGFRVAPFPGVAPLGLPLLGGDPLALPAGRDVALLRALLAAGASAKEDAEGEVPLVTALWLGRLDYLALVAGHNPDPNLRDLVRTGHKLAAPFNLSFSHTLRASFFFVMTSSRYVSFFVAWRLCFLSYSTGGRLAAARGHLHEPARGRRVAPRVGQLGLRRHQPPRRLGHGPRRKAGARTVPRHCAPVRDIKVTATMGFLCVGLCQSIDRTYSYEELNKTRMFLETLLVF
jgi:hypothetical protein